MFTNVFQSRDILVGTYRKKRRLSIEKEREREKNRQRKNTGNSKMEGSVKVELARMRGVI